MRENKEIYTRAKHEKDHYQKRTDSDKDLFMSDHISNIFSINFILKIVKFMVVGTLGTFVNLAFLYLFTDIFKIYYIISEIIAFFISVIHNYLLNKIWTFKEEFKEQLINKYFRYTTICLISLLSNLSMLFILVEFYHIWYIYAEILATGGSSLINFLGSLLWTFRKPKGEKPK